MRICTFLPSATEIVYLLGLGDSLYAVSHECDFPSAALGKPKVVRSRFDPDTLTSAEIDKLVTEMMTRGENIYEVDEDTLAEARPDLFTQQLCEVCAVRGRSAGRRRLDSRPKSCPWIRMASTTFWKTSCASEIIQGASHPPTTPSSTSAPELTWCAASRLKRKTRPPSPASSGSIPS